MYVARFLLGGLYYMYIKIPGYELTKVVYEGIKYTIFQAVREQPGKQKVLIKALKEGFNTPRQIATLQHEAAISKKINSRYVLKAIDFIQVENTSALIQEDLSGQPLSTFLREKTLDLRSILEIAIGIAKGIADIHREFIMHKDIKPQNIIISSPNNATIIDFSISTLLSKEVQSVVRPDALEGSIHYISPEQTGRMNRSLDYRTDIYSFGIVLFEMLTGELPFHSDDLMELVYMHITKPVPHPIDINPSIPKVLSEIVVKCMEKDQEDRYFSALGLSNDLELCLKLLDENGNIDYFVPGAHDVYDRFNIPQKLYGREKEIAFLHRRLNHRTERPTVTMVTGYVGIGKTSVIVEARGKGYFIVGECEQAKQNVPFYPFILAFEDLVHQLLSETNTNVDYWKKEITSALGTNLLLLTALIPDLELIVGPQPDIEKIDFSFNEKRVVVTLVNFIRVLTDNFSHELAIFLDDLQWADNSSLKFLYTLTTYEDIKNLHIIGTYRNDGKDSNTQLDDTLSKIAKEKALFETLEVPPLTINSINQLVSDVLHVSLDNAFPLASLVYKKTQGNPYFIRRFLHELYKEGLIKFNLKTQSWESDLESIQKMGTTENVANLIDKTLKKLTPETLELLKIASLLGTSFDMRVLCMITGRSKADVAKCLWEAIQEECILPLQTFYSLDMLSNIDFDNTAVIPEFKFQYERIKKTVCDLIPQQEIVTLHVNIGKVLMNQLSPKKKEEQFLEIVDHLNFGKNLLENESERMQLAMYNQIAGQTAFKTFAYPLAEKYFTTSLQLISEKGWKEHYSLVFNLYQQLAISVHLSGRQQEALNILEYTLKNSNSDLDRATICVLQMEPLVSFSTLKEAYDKGKEALKYLGITSFEMSNRRIEFELKLLKIRFSKNKLKSIASWPKAKDEKGRLLSTIYSLMVAYGLYIPSNEYLVIIIKGLKNILKQGIYPTDITVVLGYTLSLIAFSSNYKDAYSIGKAVFSWGGEFLDDRTSFAARYLFLTRIANYGDSYDRIIIELKDQLKNAAQFEQFWLNSSIISYALSIISFIKGESLEIINREVVDSVSQYIKTSTTGFVYYHLRWRQVTRIFLNEVENFYDESFHKWGSQPELFESMVQREREIPVVQFGDLAVGLMIDFYRKKFEKGIQKYNDIMENYAGYFPSDLSWQLVYFYGALCLAGELKVDYNRHWMKSLKRCQKQLELLSENGSGNFNSFFHLVSAEIAFLNGEINDALKLTDNAIRESKLMRNLNLEAVAYELAAFYYKSQNKELEEKLYLKNAFETYEKWGAIIKLNQLEKEFPDIVHTIAKKQPSAKKETAAASYSFKNSITSTTSTGRDELAFQAFIKSAQALSEEIQLEKLVTKLMRLVMVNAGAEKAYLILSQGDHLVVEAEISKEQENAKLSNRVPIESKDKEMCLSVIQYVARSMKSVLLADAAKEGMFTRDPYILAYHAHSILCMPLIYQGKLTGVLYLENSLMKDAFTKENTSLLSLLSTQIAISIENARFYAMLEDKVALRTTELSEKNTTLTLTLDELKEAQEQLVQSEKLTALGQLIAGIAHEINTPLGAVKASSENLEQAIGKIIETFSVCIEMMDFSKWLSFLDIIKRSSATESPYDSKEERQIRRNLIEVYKNAEIPNYVEATEFLIDMGIYEDISHLLKPFDDDVITILNLAYNFKSLRNNSRNIQQAVEQASKIIFALKGYIQKDSSQAMIAAQLTEGMDTVLTLYHHQLKHSIEVIRNYHDVPVIFCRPNEINQVWTNLIHNAIYAMGGKGKLEIEMTKQDNNVVIQISDTGIGIPEEIHSKIFSPFFSTKPKGEGSGLGLSICKKIIEAHGGTIKFVSKPGKTIFVVTLPIVSIPVDESNSNSTPSEISENKGLYSSSYKDERP